MSNLSELALEEATLSALGAAVKDRLTDVKKQMQKEMEAAGVSKLEARLPDGTPVAKISRPDTKPKAEVVDDDAFLAWVREHAPHNVQSKLVTFVRPAFTTSLLEQCKANGAPKWLNTETGEVHDVAGVQVRTERSSSHSVYQVNGGRAAIAAAWRAGTLPVLPQLTAGDAEPEGEAQ